jgi:tetratricopeptide (TPR) repeat protein
VPFELNARSEMALIAVHRGRPEAALEQVKRCREIVSGGEDFRGLLGRAALADAVTAANLGQHESAEERFSAAVKNLVRYDLPWERANAEQLWGEARLMAGDRAGAAERFDAAIDIYRRHEAGAMWAKAVETAKKSAARKAIAMSSGPESSRPDGGEQFVEGVFRHEGDYWTLSYQGSVLRLRNTNGLHYLSHLLGRPAERISAADLARVIRKMQPTKHSRATGSSSERSRVMVTKGIKAAIAKIRANRSALGRHLATSIQTGHWCVYQPDPDDQITWRISKQG